MPTERAIDLRNRTDKLQASTNGRPHLITRPPMQRKNCWTPQENNDMIDTIVRGWHCCPIFMISLENDEGQEEEELLEDDVFDGAHKIEAVINFINDKFKLEKLDKSSPIKQYEGKKYTELPLAIRTKINNYEFLINYIDTETANNKDSLKLLWKRLNKSGKPLNDYELALPVITGLVNKVLKPSLQLFLKSEIFQRETSSRGQAEKLLQIILATSEGSVQDKHMREFNSKKGLVNLWQETILGETISVIDERTEQNKEKWLENLKKAASYMQSLKEANCFINNKNEEILQPAHRGTELIFIIGRAVYHFPKPEDFRRLSSEIAELMKNRYFIEVTTQKPKIIRDEAGRNGNLQRRLLREIDAHLAHFASLKETRLFTKEHIELKFTEQKGICVICKMPMLKNQPHVGDHIIPWSLGGRTVIENCQVTHKRCNSAKSDRLD